MGLTNGKMLSLNGKIRLNLEAPKKLSNLENQYNKLMKKNDYLSIISHINKLKLPLDIREYFSIYNLNKILSFMIKDKKNKTKKINLILLKKIGSTIINNHYETKKIKKFLRRELIN